MNNRLDIEEIVLTPDKNLRPEGTAKQLSMKPQHNRECTEQKERDKGPVASARVGSGRAWGR